MNRHRAIETLRTMLRERKDQQKELDQEIQSIEHTLKLAMGDYKVIELPEALSFEPGLSLTKKRERALVQWAKQNQGLLIPKEAKHALVAAGLLKPERGASWLVYNAIGEMDCWEKIEPGKYRLAEAPALGEKATP